MYKKYYHDKLSPICASLKQTWCLITSGVSSKHSSYGPTAMKDNRGNTINNPQLIANKFNEFFTNIGPSLAIKTPHSTVDHKSYLSGSFSDSFFASPTTPDDIINIVSSLKSSNSEGVDGVDVNVIEASIDLFASPLSQMCNISFSTGIVPDNLRIGKVIPMFKNEDSANFTNN